MTHNYVDTKFDPGRNHLEETASVTPISATTPAVTMRFSTRMWQAWLRNAGYTQPPDFAWTVMQEEVQPGPTPALRFSEHRLLDREGTTSSTRPYELLLLSILLCAVIGYVSWQEAKAYWQSPPAAAQAPSTALPGDELALIEIEVDPLALNPQPVPYRSKHFYHRVAGVWQPTTPDAAYWGERHTLETDYFRLEFYDPDAPVVAAVATDLDALLRTLYRQVGLASPSRQQKLVIHVVPNPELQRHTLDPFNPPAALSVSSPTLQPIPLAWTEADMVRSEILQHLATLTLFQKIAPQSRAAWWGDSGVQGVLRWLLDQGQAGTVGAFGHDAVRRAWLQSGVANPAPRLVDISGPYLQPQKYNTYWIETYWVPELDRQAMTVASLIEYALSTYGQEHLPSLIDTMRHQEDRTEHIPAIFGVSVETFEHGWHTYLAKQRRQW